MDGDEDEDAAQAARVARLVTALSGTVAMARCGADVWIALTCMLLMAVEHVSMSREEFLDAMGRAYDAQTATLRRAARRMD